MNGIGALINEAPESSFTPSPREDTVRRHRLLTRKRVLARHQVCRHHDLRLPVSKSMSNKRLLISHPVYAIFVIAAQTD